MIILIAGSSHTGKTVLAQRLLEKLCYPYLSIDHLKMGLIRSKQTELTVSDDKELTQYLWGILKEIIKTAIENDQNLIIEGCYIPFDWKAYFSNDYLPSIKYRCLVMSADYITKHFDQILLHADEIEKRIDDTWCAKDSLIKDNEYNLKQCKKNNLDYIYIEDKYSLNIDWA